MKRSLRSAAILLVLISSALVARVQNLHEITVLTLLGRPLQFVVADQKGIFTRHGLQVVNSNKANSDEVRGELAAGKADVAYLAVDNAVAMVELAKADAIIVMGGEGSQNELIVQPEITSVQDLRGKTLIVDAVNTAYALQMKKILLLSRMQAGRDYEMKPYGATPARLIAMREHKEFAGSMLGPPASITAKHEGFRSLGSVQDIIGPYQAAGFFTMRQWAHDNRDVLVPFLAACIEAQRWLMDSRNKQEVIALLATQTKLKPEVAAGTYDSLMSNAGGYAKDAMLDKQGFENVLKLRAEVEGQWNGDPPTIQKYYDPAYYNAALKIAKGQE